MLATHKLSNNPPTTFLPACPPTRLSACLPACPPAQSPARPPRLPACLPVCSLPQVYGPQLTGRLQQMLSSGIPVTINSDDPAYFGPAYLNANYE